MPQLGQVFDAFALSPIFRCKSLEIDIKIVVLQQPLNF